MKLITNIVKVFHSAFSTGTYYGQRVVIIVANWDAGPLCGPFEYGLYILKLNFFERRRYVVPDQTDEYILTSSFYLRFELELEAQIIHEGEGDI